MEVSTLDPHLRIIYFHRTFSLLFQKKKKEKDKETNNKNIFYLIKEKIKIKI